MPFNKELKVAICAAEKAGALLLEGFYEEDKGEERKGTIDPVTKYDRLSEKSIIDDISKAFPDDLIMAEESSQGWTEGKRRWIIDPLDGTVNFSHNHPVWSVSIGLEVDGEDVVGVVYAPVLKELFAGSKGTGATLNGKTIHVSTRDKLINSLLATGFPYAAKYRQMNVENTGNMLGNCMGVRRLGSAAVDLCFVACGRLDGFWELGLKPWDTAAGELIIREAGGKVSDFKGGQFISHKGNIVASNGLIHEEMLQRVWDE